MRRWMSLSLLCLAVLSCTKDGIPPGQEGTARSGLVRVGLQIDTGGPLTRSAGTEEESRVDQVAVLAFDESDALCASSLTTLGGQPFVEVPDGRNVRLFAIANPTNDFSSVETLSDFYGMGSSYSANAADCLEMMGTFAGRFSRDTSITVSVERFAAKFQLDTIVYRLPEEYDTYISFDTSYGSFTNATSVCPYSLEAVTDYIASTKFVVPIGWERITVGTYGPYPTGDGYKYWISPRPWSLYVYPNPDPNHKTAVKVEYKAYFTAIVDDGGTPRQITYSHTHDFSITFPTVSRNTFYHVQKVVVTRLGTQGISLMGRGGLNIEYEMEEIDMLTGESRGVIHKVIRHDTLE